MCLSGMSLHFQLQTRLNKREKDFAFSLQVLKIDEHATRLRQLTNTKRVLFGNSKNTGFCNPWVTVIPVGCFQEQAGASSSALESEAGESSATR